MRPPPIRAIMMIAFVVFWSLVFGRSGQAGGQQAGTAAAWGPAPTVHAIATVTDPSPYQPSPDLAMAPPNHPPIALVPPKPMPDNPDWSRIATSTAGPGQGVMYDAVARQEMRFPYTPAAGAATFGSGGGYDGADGGVGSEAMPATMGAMSLLSAATRATFPFRMNVKLLMRWGGSYFVCSGSMREGAAVLTAGHCVYDEGTNTWADEIWIYPAWDGVGSLFGPPSIVNPYGWAHSTMYGSWTGWTVNHDFNYDIGIVAMDRASGFLTGWFGWAWGFDCAFATSTAYNSGSYPSQTCSDTLHTGADMYFWGGSFDSCPNTNRLGLNTPIHGCLGAVWGGMSGSGAYYISGGGRYTHAVTSTSNRFDYAEYTRQWGDWVNWLNDTFVPVYVWGANFNMQPLDVNGPAVFVAGQSTGGLAHLATNTGNAAQNANYTFEVYLSSNDAITTADTLISVQNYNWNFAAVSDVSVNMAGVTIPANTPPGSYFLGVRYVDATDGNSSDNDTSGWDALPITVLSSNLLVDNLTAPLKVAPGLSFNVSDTVRNAGTAATGPFRVGYYLATSTACARTMLIGSRMLTGLGAGATSSATTSVTIPSGSALGSRFVCAIADDGSEVGEFNESDNTRAFALTVVSQTPVLTLKVNGQHPTPPVVTTTGPMQLTLDLSDSLYTAAVDWYWALVVNGQLLWVTSTGISTTPAPLAHMAPMVLTNATLINTTLPRGTTLTSAMFLLNGSTMVASDFITAQVPASVITSPH